MTSIAARSRILGPLLALRQRQTWVLAHRWVGLVMAVFLIVAGLTGSMLAFYDELEVLNSPELQVVVPPRPDAQALNPVSLRERAQALVPDARIHRVRWPTEPDRSIRFRLESVIDAATGKSVELPDNELFLDPYTGEGTVGWANVFMFAHAGAAQRWADKTCPPYGSTVPSTSGLDSQVQEDRARLFATRLRYRL